MKLKNISLSVKFGICQNESNKPLNLNKQAFNTIEE